MADCNAGALIGKNLAVEFALLCPNIEPTELDWKRLGAMRSKSLDLAWDTIDTTTDSSKGAIRSAMASFQTLSFSGDGLVSKEFTEQIDNYFNLLKHVAQPPAETGGQPLGWLRLTDEIKTWVIPVLFSNFSESAPYDDAQSYSLEATANPTTIPVSLKKTPPPTEEP